MKNVTKTKEYYKESTITFTESTSTRGRHFKYNDVTIENALVIRTEGKETIEYITINPTSGLITSASKRSKTLKFTGESITQRQYSNLLKKWLKLSNQKEVERIEKTRREKEAHEQLVKEANEDVLAHICLKKELLREALIQLNNPELTKEEVNRIENHAVGIVGFRFTKLVGWRGILVLIKENI